MTANEWYELGNQHHQEGRLHEAMNCYMKALELDPLSPAGEAKKMLESIFQFYCKDIYNP